MWCCVLVLKAQEQFNENLSCRQGLWGFLFSWIYLFIYLLFFHWKNHLFPRERHQPCRGSSCWFIAWLQTPVVRQPAKTKVHLAFGAWRNGDFVFIMFMKKIPFPDRHQPFRVHGSSCWYITWRQSSVNLQKTKNTKVNLTVSTWNAHDTCNVHCTVTLLAEWIW